MLRWMTVVPMLLLAAGASPVRATSYTVGPGQPYATLQDVAPLLAPGDEVAVAGDATYPGDVVFTRPGTAAQPIVIRGLRVNGQRPVISGGTNGVTFATPWPYSGPGADHYVFEGFEITDASFRGLYHQAHDLTVRDVRVHDCAAHGILGADQGSGSLTLEFVEVHGCGGGTTHHQIYMATDEANRPGSVFRMRHCYVHDANGGNNVKSRAERNEIHYNWIEGAVYHELELIGPDPGMPAAPPREDSDVVGNVLWCKNDFYVVRFGGDATGETDGRYRFVHNTVIAMGPAVFRLFDGLESIEMHNNVFHRLGDGAVTLLRTTEADWATGAAVIAGGGNWVKTGAVQVPTQWTATVYGSDPGFADLTSGDLRPLAGSPLRDGAVAVPAGPPGFPFPAPLFPPADHPPAGVLPVPAIAEARPVDPFLDIGAYEYAALTIDGDTLLAVTDLVVLQLTLAGVITPGQPPCVCPLCADLDGDGALTAADSLLLAGWLAGNG